MQKLNFQYRSKNTTTDVLSFPLNEQLEGEFLLGEIVVSVDKAKADAEFLGIPFEKEVIILLIHGITHLLGFDHNNDQQETEMKEVENKLMNLIKLTEGVVTNG
jgi:probable rRNA maturation factor